MRTRTRRLRLSSFVGRAAELAALGDLVRRHRLVTLIGPGGVGKTRLAELLAADACWVDLAPLNDPNFVAEAALAALGVADAPGRPALDRLLGFVADREVTLILDNCEHLREPCAAVVSAVLSGCARARVVATSREPLGVEGEVTWGLQPLPPADAARLFLERAAAVRADVAAEPEAAEVITAICARLDGIPLAIELAAARTRLLTPTQVLVGLNDRFDLLTGGVHDAPRQRTLEASIAWSHDLLADEERRLFRRVAVFSGGFTLAAASAVGGPGTRDNLQGLVAKSLVVADHGGEAARYRLYETIREFAARELELSGEAGVVRDAHLEHYLTVAQDAEARLVGVTAELLERLAPEQDNYRAGLDWALARGHTTAALEIARPYAFLLINRGRYREARAAVEGALALPAAAAVPRAAALWTLGGVQWVGGDLAGLEATAGEMITLARGAADPGLEGRAQILHVWLRLFTDPNGAADALTAAAPLAEAAGDHWALMDIACERLHLAMRTDDTAGAAELFSRAQALADAHGSDWFRAWNLVAHAHVGTRTGALQQARLAAARGMALARSLGDTVVAGFGAAALAAIELLEDRPSLALHVAEGALRDCAAAAAEAILPALALVRAQAMAAMTTFPAAEVRTAFEQAVTTARACADPWQEAPAALALALHLIQSGEPASAEAQLADVRACGALLGSPWAAAAADHAAGLLAAAMGEPGRAEDLLHEALAGRVDHGFVPGAIDSLEELANLLAEAGKWAPCARLLAAGTAQRHALGYHAGHARTLAAAAATRSALTETQFAAAWAEGATVTLPAIATYAARTRGPRKRPHAGWASLTPTELTVAHLAATGLRNAEIAERLFIRTGTAKVHLSNIYAKLGLTNRAQLAAEVTRREV